MKKIIFTLIATMFFAINFASAVAPMETASFFNGPTVSAVGNTGANFSLSQKVLSSLTEEEKKKIYFEYFETMQVCIMIYPTPEYCLPKKTAKGELSVNVANLKPNTEYSVQYKIDTNIVCIQAPCPTNDFASQTVTFKTKNQNTDPVYRSLYFGSRGEDVRELQNKLIEKGFMGGRATGYFGYATLRAVKNFQSDVMKIYPVGVVGAKTRLALDNFSVLITETSEKFSGTLQAVSTGCFVDGICSATVDGKVVVIIRGWSQEVVGSLKGFESIGDMEKYIGRTVTVYAKKTSDGYTLYGNKDYYIELVK